MEKDPIGKHPTDVIWLLFFITDIFKIFIVYIGEGKAKSTTTKRTTTSTSKLTTILSTAEQVANSEGAPSVPSSGKPNDGIKEGDKCNFKGQVTDKENCASKKFFN